MTYRRPLLPLHLFPTSSLRCLALLANTTQTPDRFSHHVISASHEVTHLTALTRLGGLKNILRVLRWLIKERYPIIMSGHAQGDATKVRSPQTHRRRESLQLDLTADEPEEVYGLKHPVAHPRVTIETRPETEGSRPTNVNANVHAPLDDSADEGDEDDHDEISSLFEDALEELGDEKLLEEDNGS